MLDRADDVVPKRRGRPPKHLSLAGKKDAPPVVQTTTTIEPPPTTTIAPPPVTPEIVSTSSNTLQETKDKVLVPDRIYPPAVSLSKGKKKKYPDVKDTIHEVFERLGGVGRLHEWADQPGNINQFYTQIWGKIIPRDVKAEVTGKDGESIRIELMRNVNVKVLTDEELERLTFLTEKCLPNGEGGEESNE